MQGLDLVFYGDSITESWRGTEMNHTGKRSEGVDRVYAAHFSKYRSIVLAIAGERLGTELAHGVCMLRAEPVCICQSEMQHDTLGLACCLSV